MGSNGICVAEVIRSTDGDDTGGICWCSEFEPEDAEL
jgi:hypothetical protein